MQKQKSQALLKSGFTLVELLIVVAVIVIIATIVINNLVDAKQRSREAAIMSAVRQIATVMGRQYADTGSFSALQLGWVGSNTTTCAGRGFTGNYAAELIQACESIEKNLGNVDYQLLIGNSVNTVTEYSLMAKLEPENGSTGVRFFCIGSSGKTSLGDYNAAAPGCYNNP